MTWHRTQITILICTVSVPEILEMASHSTYALTNAITQKWALYTVLSIDRCVQVNTKILENT